MGETVFRALMNALLGSAVVWRLVGPPPGPTAWLFALIALFGTWILNFCMTCLIGLSAFLVAFGELVRNAFLIAKKPGQVLVIILLAATVNLILNLFLIPRMGIFGAALAACGVEVPCKA